MSLAKARFDLWSNDPPDNRQALLLGALLASVGLLLLLGGVNHMLGQPWDLRERGVAAVGLRAERDYTFGDRYAIEVDGARHECHRGAQKVGQASVTVLYDPADPSRCRAEDTADRLGDYERNIFRAAGPVSLCGLSLLLAWFAEPRPRPLREDPVGLLRPRLMLLARGVLALAILLTVIELILKR